MDKISSLVDKAINSLDWPAILSVYKNLGWTWHRLQDEDEMPKKKRKPRMEILSDQIMKEDLKKIIYFAIDNKYYEFIYGNWIIVYIDPEIEGIDDGLGKQIEVIFCLSSATTFEFEENDKTSEVETLEDTIKDFETSIVEHNKNELKSLKKLLVEVVQKEEYEKAQEIHDKIKKLEKRKK
jgi:hypothetical protein